MKNPSYPGVLAALVAVLLLAAACYLFDVNRSSFWEDESWMAVAIKDSPLDLWTFATERGVHPPLYFYIGWLFARLTSDSELAMRWLSGLCALVGVAFSYRLGAVWFGRRAGVYTALMAAGSIFLIYFARMSRHYTLFFTLGTALAWAYARWWHTLPPRPEHADGAPAPGASPVNRWWWAVVLLNAALLWTHYFGVWMALVLALHAFITRRGRDVLGLLAALALSGALFLPWLPSVVAQFNRGGLGYVTQDAKHGFNAYLDRVSNDSRLLGYALAALGLFALWRWRSWRKTSAGLFIAIWLVLPLALSLLINIQFPWFVERNMIFTLSGVFLLFAAGLVWLGRSRAGRWTAAALALVFVGNGLARYTVFWPPDMFDWRGVVDVMTDDSRPSDLYVVSSGETYSLQYYLERDMGQPVTITTISQWLEYPEEAPDRIWLVDANWAVRFEAQEALPPDAVQTRRIVLGPVVSEFYQRAPQQTLAVFGDQIAFGKPDLPDPLLISPGDTLKLDLWWQAVKPPQADYSVGVYLIAPDGRVVAQHDGGFDGGRVPAGLLPTDRWTPDARALSLPADLPPGDYLLTAAVYDWRDNTRLAPDSGGRETLDFPFLTVRVGG